jgi:hypothetical protein
VKTPCRDTAWRPGDEAVLHLPPGAREDCGSAINTHARINTTSGYTSARVFAMLPERLSRPI